MFIPFLVICVVRLAHFRLLVRRLRVGYDR
jgi:hypothetical protein